MFELTFQFENDEKPVVISVSPEESVLDAARKANVAIDAPCSGNGSCGKCRVKLVSGELTGPQTSHISDEEYAEGWRLSCCMHAASDAVVLVPDIASAYRSRMKTADLSSGEEVRIFEELLAGVRSAGISLGNGFRAVDLQLDEPTLDDTMPDNERLTRALEAQDGIDSVRLPWYAMRRLPKALRDNAFAVRVLGELQNGIFTVFDVTGQNDTLPLCGVGIDIGTTTVSAVLFDMKDGRLLSKASGGNGQIRYGADVINRIIEQGKPGGRKKLQDAILKETLVPLMQTLCKDAKLPPARIVRLCVAGNTTMNHLFVGVDADPVRMEPYIPTFFHWDGLRVHDLGLPAHPDAAIRREVALNEVDIDNFIRAKGAIYSAIDTLLAAMDMDESVIESFYVAGGIGSGINMRNAVRIGMFPNVPLELFHYIGNSSLAGAYTMALSDEANDRVEQVARNMTYMELSTHPGYMDAFVAACFLPHTDAARFASAE